MHYHCNGALDLTFLTAVVEVVGKQVGWEVLGHLLKPHQVPDFQLLWSEEETQRYTKIKSSHNL